MRKNIQGWPHTSPISTRKMLNCLGFHGTALTELHHSHWKLTWYERGVGDFCVCLRHKYGFQASNTGISNISNSGWERAQRKYLQGTTSSTVDITVITFVTLKEAGYLIPRREQDSKTSFLFSFLICSLAPCVCDDVECKYRNWNLVLTGLYVRSINEMLEAERGRNQFVVNN